MDPVLAFLAAIIAVSLMIPKLGPFLSLVVSSIFYGLLVGMEAELMSNVATGMGRIFSSLAIVIFAGAIIAEYLRKTGAIDRIVADLQSLTHRSLLVAGAAGYIVSLPVMCSITAFMILEPVVSCLGQQAGGASKRFLFMTAACSIISFNLIYPSPVMVSLSSDLNVPANQLLARGIPISLILFILAYFIMMRLPAEEATVSECPVPKIGRARAWIPLALPMLLILLGFLGDKARFIGNPSFALLLSALLCLALAWEKIQDIIHIASRRSGVILLDLCGAGAFGYVVAQSGIGEEIYGFGRLMPLLLLPFLVAAILQLAQGSRVVTVVVAAQVLAGYPLDGLTLALLISSGAFMFSYVSDPYFWLIKSSTGANMGEVVKGYTLPLGILGLASFAITAIYFLL